MAEQLFIRVLNMSLTGSFVILAVLVMRLFLRRVPRMFSYCLWAVVLFRLLCPVSFTAGFSLLGALEQPSTVYGRMEYIPEEIALAGGQDGWTGNAVEPFYPGDISAGKQDPEADAARSGVKVWGVLSGETLGIVMGLGARIWLFGICVMAGYSIVTMAGFMRKLRGARWESENIYVTTEVMTPFVMGFIKPRIYLPAGLEGRERDYVLLHERIHLKRRDHIAKLVFFLALCLHWFNPLVWAAFFFSEKDMEMSCDEAVIRKSGIDVKKEYTASLLGMATGRRIVGGVPLAFGEGDTGSRIRNVLRYRKPAGVVLVAAAVVCCVVAAALLANPGKKQEEKAPEGKTQEGKTQEEMVQEVYYGVVSDILVEGTPQRVIVIPGWWDVMDIPEADHIFTYFEREEQELLAGDMVQITFPAGAEVAVMETWPARFAQKAESIVVMWSGCILERLEGDIYRVSFAAGVVPGYETAEAGDVLSLYWEKGDPEAPAYLSRVPEGEDSVLVAQTPLLAVEESLDGIRMFTVELTVEQLQRMFEGFGFHIRFELEPSGRTTGEELPDSQLPGGGDQDKASV